MVFVFSRKTEVHKMKYERIRIIKKQKKRGYQDEKGNEMY